MNDIARDKLKELVRRFGTSLADDSSRCRGMLKDVCGEYRKEIAGLLAALEEKVPAELLDSPISLDITRARLSKKLEEDRGLAKDVAVWAVDSWALALNLVDENELKTTNSVAAVSPKPSRSQSLPNPTLSTPSLPPPPNPVRVNSTPPLATPKNIRGYIEVLGKGIKIEMVKIPAGSFAMGSPGSGDEAPLHRIDVGEFYMGKYTVTQSQYQEIAKSNLSDFKGANLPVETVNWHDAKNFCQYLNIYSGKNYRLPSEAEWEYACRAGSTGSYCFGDDENLLEQYAWYGKNSGDITHPVGQKKPNGYGLYDMHGNVWEWCEDAWHENYNGAPIDGSAWVSGGDTNKSLVRGGCWFNDAYYCRTAYRSWVAPDYRGNAFGFRVVCVLR